MNFLTERERSIIEASWGILPIHDKVKSLKSQSHTNAWDVISGIWDSAKLGLASFMAPNLYLNDKHKEIIASQTLNHKNADIRSGILDTASIAGSYFLFQLAHLHVQHNDVANLLVGIATYYTEKSIACNITTVGFNAYNNLRILRRQHQQ